MVRAINSVRGAQLRFSQKLSAGAATWARHLFQAGSRIRENDASFLVYSLVDAVVDHCFPILENMGERLEDLEHRILENPTPDSLRDIYRLVLA